jgi:hypothetical protein
MVQVSPGVFPWGADGHLVVLLHSFERPGAVVEPTRHRLHSTATHRALGVVISDDIEPLEPLRIDEQLLKSRAGATRASTFDVEPLADLAPPGSCRRELSRDAIRAV